MVGLQATRQQFDKSYGQAVLDILNSLEDIARFKTFVDNQMKVSPQGVDPLQGDAWFYNVDESYAIRASLDLLMTTKSTLEASGSIKLLIGIGI